MTSNPIVLKTKEFDVENIVFSKPKTTKHGSTVIYVNYKNPEIGKTHKLRLQLPKMPVPGGIQAYQQKDKQDRVIGVRYSMFLSFANVDTNKRRKTALEKFRALDDRIIDGLVRNCRLWLKQPNVTPELAEMLYKRCVKFSKNEDQEPDGKYPDSIKVNLPSNDQGEITVDAFDENAEPIRLTGNMDKGSSVIPILECNGLWVVGSQLHLSWKVVNIQVFPTDRIRGFAIRPDSEDEAEIDRTAAADATTTPTASDEEQPEEPTEPTEQEVE